MKKFDFLFKPIFFITSLLFAAWMLMKIENSSPSDFGDRETKQKLYNLSDSCLSNESKKYLQNLCSSYKAGMIDSARLDEKLTIFLKFNKNNFAK